MRPAALVVAACALLALRAEAGPATPSAEKAPTRAPELACAVEKGQVTVNGVVLPAPPGVKTVSVTTIAAYHVTFESVKAAEVEKRVAKLQKHFAGKKVAGMKLGPFVREQRGFVIYWTARGMSKPGVKPFRSWSVSFYVRGRLEGDTPRFQDDPTPIGLGVGYHEDVPMTELELEQARARCGK